MTNYEYLKNASIEQIASYRVFRGMNCWYGDFKGCAGDYEEAIEREISWLKEERADV